VSLRDAAQQALDALKLARLNGKNGLYPGELEEVAAIITALETALAEPQPEIEQLKAERDALLAAAEKGTEYVLAHINQDLRAERDALLADAERYRWLRRKDREFINDEMSNVGAVDSIMVCVFDDDCDAISFFEGELDAAIDAARGEA
jgi:hypothetical protein